ncbi:MAG: recombinase RecA [Armatimonadetes bacterium]|nr:recombinase RecA [Armatimonadota bacterium]
MAVTDGDKKSKALELALSQIHKQHGEGAVMRLGEQPNKLAVEIIPTGALTLDIALGVGGLPRGRIVEIYGNEGSGKTTLALSVLAEAQRLGGTVAFIDAEHAFPRELAETMGLNLDELLVSQPDTGEQALEITDTLVRSGAVDCIVIDSVAALVPAAELQGEMGDSHVGLQARLMSQALRKLGGSVDNTRSVVIFINQIREKIGVMFGNPETTPGGRALKFWSSVRLELRRAESLKNGTDIIGGRCAVKVVKNKVAPPFKKTEFDIMYGQGISKEGCILDEAVARNIVTKSGSWFNYGEDRLGQGRENVVAFLAENKTLCREIERTILEQVGIATADAPAEETPPADDEEGTLGLSE